MDSLGDGGRNLQNHQTLGDKPQLLIPAIQV
jgi:hypothetical protein